MPVDFRKQNKKLPDIHQVLSADSKPNLSSGYSLLNVITLCPLYSYKLVIPIFEHIGALAKVNSKIVLTVQQ